LPKSHYKGDKKIAMHGCHKIHIYSTINHSRPQRDYLYQQGVDPYAKKLYTHQLIKLLVFAQLKQHKGLRGIS
jgi:hypothetical protein